MAPVDAKPMTRSKWLRRSGTIAGVLAVVAFIGPSFLPSDYIARPIAAAIEHATGRKFVVEGGISLRLLPTPGVSAELLSLANPAWAGNEPFIAVDRVDARLSLTALLHARIEFEDVEITGLRVNLRMDGAGQRNWLLRRQTRASAEVNDAVEAPSPVPLSQAPPQPGRPMPSMASPTLATSSVGRRTPSFLLHSVRINDARFTFIDPSGKVEAAEDIDAEFIAHDETVDGAGRLRYENQEIRFALSLDDLGKLTSEAGSVIAAHAEIGRVTTDFHGRAGLEPQLHGAVDLNIRIQPRQGSSAAPLALSARLSVGDQIVRLTDPNLAQGSYSLELGGEIAVDSTRSHPSVRGRLKVGRLDLTDFIARAKRNLIEAPLQVTVEPRESTPAPPREWRTTPLKLAALKDFDLDLVLSGGPIILPASQIGPLSVTLSLTQGHFTASIPEAPIGDGRFQFTGTFDASDQAAHLRVDVAARDIKLAPPILPPDGMLGAGTISLRAQLAADGETEQAMLGSLRGTAAISIADADFQLARLYPRVASIFGTCPSALTGGLGAEATAAAGVITVSQLRLQGPQLTIAGKGTINIPQRSLALHLEGTPAACVRHADVEGYWNQLGRQVAR